MWTGVGCVAVVRSVRSTRSGALHLNLPAAAEAHAAVGVRVGEQPLADVVNLFIQLIWNVGCLEYHQRNIWGGGGKKQKLHAWKTGRRVKGSKVMRTMYLNDGVHQGVQQREDALARVPSFGLGRIYITRIKAPGRGLKRPHFRNTCRLR